MCQIGYEDNELLTLEIIHRYVEILDRFFGNVRFLLLRSLIVFLLKKPQNILGMRIGSVNTFPVFVALPI